MPNNNKYLTKLGEIETPIWADAEIGYIHLEHTNQGTQITLMDLSLLKIDQDYRHQQVECVLLLRKETILKWLHLFKI